MLMTIDLYYNELYFWKGWLDEEKKYVADLSKLPDDRKETLDMGEFGIDGTFRKMELD